MREGSGDNEKLINDGNMSSYSESDKGGNAVTLQKEALAFNLFFSLIFFFMPTSSPSKNQVAIWRFLATKKNIDAYHPNQNKLTHNCIKIHLQNTR